MRARIVFVSAVATLGLHSAHAQGSDDLAKQSQNPLGAMISLPFENNLLFNVGPSEATGIG